jgi:hypothetical protein
MPVTVKTDPARPAGGYALLHTGQPQPVTGIAIQDRESGEFLGHSGKWGKQRTYFAVEAAGDGTVGLGPEMVDFISVDTALSIYGNQGQYLGNLIWPSVRPSAGKRPQWAIGGTPETPVPELEPAPRVVSTPRLPILVSLPPPPPPAPELRAEPKSSKLRAALAAAILLAAAIGYWVWNGSESEQLLVCANSQPYARLSELGLLVPCKRVIPPVPPKPDPEVQAYEAFRQCTGGSATCSVATCSATYLASFPTGLHSAEVRRNKDLTAQACAADKSLGQYTEFDQCMHTIDNPCFQNSCVEKYRQSVSTNPYASLLSQRADDASAQCRINNQDEADYLKFTQCMAVTEPCDRAKCSAALPPRIKTGPHLRDVGNIIQAGQDQCRPTPPVPPAQTTTPEQAVRRFLDRYYYAISSQGQAAGASLTDLYVSQPVKFNGDFKNRDEIVADHQKWAREHNSRPGIATMSSVNCDPQGKVCNVEAQLMSGYTAQFTLTDVFTSPRIAAEASFKKP